MKQNECCGECSHHGIGCIPSCYPTHCHNYSCPCHIPEPYNQRDHGHCWEEKDPPCGQKIEHLKCCLCEKLNPIVSLEPVESLARGIYEFMWNNFRYDERDERVQRLVALVDSQKQKQIEEFMSMCEGMKYPTIEHNEGMPNTEFTTIDPDDHNKEPLFMQFAHNQALEDAINKLKGDTK